MKPSTKTFRLLFVSLILTLSSVILFANSSLANEIQEEQPDQETGQGLFLGVNAGFGGGIFKYKINSSSITHEAEHGGLGGLKFGYAFSPGFALSLEGFAFSAKNDDQDWRMKSMFMAGTIHPCGTGFFLRAGVGVGRGNFTHPISGDKTTVEEHVAFLFSMGYDWWLNDHLTLGLSLDSLGIDAGGASGYEDDGMGVGGLSVQFKWFL